MRSIFCSLLIVFSYTLYSQSLLKGKILDENNLGLSFATIYVEGTTIGTTSNANGDYQLKIPSGQQMIIVRFVGYQKLRESISTRDGQSINRNFQLKPETVQLSAVVVNADGEDPAYAIIREAINKRKFYEKEVNAFQCDVYIKGNQRLDKRPDKILGIDVEVDTGIVYLSESISKLQFEQPAKYNEVMISSKVSGDNNAFSWNQASSFYTNFYQNQFELEGLSERGFVSPIANNAFLFYDYELEGFFEEDNNLVNKIAVIPKRNTDPVFSGFIYIVEDSWRIHSTDLLLTKERGIEFVDSIKINQVFAPSEFGIFMPISQEFSFQFKAFGFKGSGYFLSMYTNYKVEPNYDIYEKYEDKKLDQDSIPVVDLFQKKDFNNEILVIQEGANERDSIYWKNVRPMPLTKLETRDYYQKDSIAIVKSTREYKDSVDQNRNKVKPAPLILAGYNYTNSYKGYSLNFPSILGFLNFNTVEGLAPFGTFRFTKRNPEKDNQYLFSIFSKVRYGFSNNRFQMTLGGNIDLNPRKQKSLSIEFGRYVNQFNSAEPISEAFNTYFTLFEGNNYMKIYQKSFANVGYREEILNGLFLNSSLNFENRVQLQNTNEYAFREENVSRITSNDPVNNEISDTGFDQHQALILNVSFTYRPGQKYISRPDRKINLGSKYPEFTIGYRKGLNPGSIDSDFDHLYGKINDNVSFGLVGRLDYSVGAGIFLNDNFITFPDFKHFNGNLTYFGNFQTENFQTLDYYSFSTQDRYFEAHAEHHFNEFILNKIPLIKKLNWQTVVSTHFVSTPISGQYFEFGVGIEHIFKFFRVDYYRGYLNGRISNVGIRVGAGF